MTAFDILLAIGIVWLIWIYICVRHEKNYIKEHSCHTIDWFEMAMVSMLFTLMTIVAIYIIYFISDALFKVNWYGFFHNKVV